jgi:hypothetical protein
MEMNEITKVAKNLAKPFRVTGEDFRLKDFDPGDTLDFTSEDKPGAKEALATGAPWYVVPADNKWFTRVIVAAAVIDALASLDLKYPKVSKEKLKELAAAKRALSTGK